MAFITDPLMAFTSDPRPDLAEDSALWSLVLNVVRETNPQLAANLHGFRCEGTRLKRSRKWGLIIEPILPDAGVGTAKGAGAEAAAGAGGVAGAAGAAGAGTDSDVSDVTGWQDREDYQAMAQKYLRPYHRELVEIFKRIG